VEARAAGLLLVFAWLAIGAGCGNAPIKGPRAIVVVAGSGGDGPWYAGLRQSLREARPDAHVQTFSWGAPLPLFVLNLQDRGIHEKAEDRLARRIAEFRQQHPDGRLALVAHSAGCGVTLGALARLAEGVSVDQAILLAPSVSPAYDLAPALRRLSGKLHVFHSPHDTFHLRWRTASFGTYDNVKTAAAGLSGFTLDSLDASLRSRVVQHPYRPEWKESGHDGEHWGPVASGFAAQVIAPLLVKTD
jgi:pimeloyl-ACP methyl ester carboxylesterase